MLIGTTYNIDTDYSKTFLSLVPIPPQCRNNRHAVGRVRPSVPLLHATECHEMKPGAPGWIRLSQSKISEGARYKYVNSCCCLGTL